VLVNDIVPPRAQSVSISVVFVAGTIWAALSYRFAEALKICGPGQNSAIGEGAGSHAEEKVFIAAM